MLDYKNYQPEEFATDQSFRNWKLGGSEEDARFWTEWLAQHPDKHRDIEKATLLLEAVQASFDQISESEIRFEMQRLAGHLDTLPQPDSEETITMPHRRFSVRPWQVAAVTLLGLMSLGWWFFKNNPTESHLSAYPSWVEASALSLTEVHNTTPSPQRIALADGSLITLQPGGKLSYQPDFTGPRREVYLSGEAFFDVARNPEKPFLVYTGQIVTRVLGTSFNVKAKPGYDQIQVVVKTGRVSVYTHFGGRNEKAAATSSPAKEVVLTPNQKVVFVTGENQFARSLVETPELLEETESKPSFVFKATPIREVFEKLENAYGIEIMYDAELMQNCYLTGSFTDEPLFEKLDLITRTLNASYQQVDGQIVITSRGC